ncbi:MAG: hypothetical protein H7124_16405 [Phycisphaerales bacterium]|nr:hypothetical protein [Hyphomonadaceae bacterium]
MRALPRRRERRCANVAGFIDAETIPDSSSRLSLQAAPLAAEFERFVTDLKAAKAEAGKF